jgi:hypothetical protein
MIGDPDNDKVAGLLAAFMSVITGVVVTIRLLGWHIPLIGRLPLDYVFKVRDLSIEVPIGTAIAISVFITAIAYIFSHLSKK